MCVSYSEGTMEKHTSVIKENADADVVEGDEPGPKNGEVSDGVQEMNGEVRNRIKIFMQD